MILITLKIGCKIHGEIKTMYNVAKKDLYKNKSLSFLLRTTNDSTSLKNGGKLLKAWAREQKQPFLNDSSR